AGTVVTGTLWSGAVSPDDAVEIYPGGARARVRGVQVHSESVDKARAGQRVAVNLSGVERSEIERGDIIAEPGTLNVTDRFDVRFTYLGIPSDEKPFESGARVHVNHGTREVLGRVMLMEADTLAPGGSAFAQLRLEAPLVPRYGDRFIVRSYSPMYTIGGGVILDTSPPRRTRITPEERGLLDALLAGDVPVAVNTLVTNRAVPMSSAEVAAALGVPRAEAADVLNAASLERVKAGNTTYFATRDALDALTAAIERELLAFHEANPAESSIPTAALRDRVDRRLDAKLFDAVLGVAAERGVAVVQAGRAHHPHAASAAKDAEAATADTLRSLLAKAALQPPSVAEMIEASGAEGGIVRRVLGALVTDGEVVRVGDLHFSASAYESARECVRAVLQGAPEGATAAQIREALGVSRKYAIPLLEHFDAQGLTRREGDLRVLRG
ncbi:MAG: SelB C-terminal domain-containing protein, partial [Actinomycetota bacterium]|nr:SelB C-terminal domain-containing protein [Actinomycetota bacterium]